MYTPFFIILLTKSEATKYAEDLKELQHRRATVTQIARPAPGGHEALLRYAAQLEALEAVFPVSETEVRHFFPPPSPSLAFC